MAHQNDFRDGVANLASKAFTPTARTWWPQNLHRLRRLWRKGQAQIPLFKGQRRDEEGSTNHITLDAGDGQYSQYEGREKLRHHLSVQNPQ